MKLYGYKYRTWLWLFLQFICLQSAFAEVSTELSSSKATVHEDIQLTYTYTGYEKDIVPDFSILEKDFSIMNISRGQQISVINGHVARQYQWVLVLNALKPGTYQIPAIKFGSEKSRPLSVKVTKIKLSDDVDARKEPVFMTATVDNKQPYVQQKILYSIKLYMSTPLLGGDLSNPKSSAQIETVQGDRQYSEVVNGKKYRVVERNYLISPEKAGSITIEAPVFQGQIANHRLHTINQLMMNQASKVLVTAPEVSLKIRPIPKNFTGDTWLPAEQLTISESWQDLTQKPTVGQPLTRIIRIKAIGLSGSQLPDLKCENTDGVNVYSQPSQTEDTAEDGKIVGTKEIKVVYIPTGSQDVTLPAIKLPWWNVKLDKQQIAELSKKSFDVYGKPPEQPTKATPAATKTETNVAKKMVAPLTPPSTSSPKSAGVTAIVAGNNFYTLLPWALVVVLSCIILYLLAQRNKQPKAQQQQQQMEQHLKNSSAGVHKKKLKKACYNNAAQDAMQFLLLWSQAKWPQHNIRNVAEITIILRHATLNNEIDKLHSVLYGQTKVWQGHNLWQSLLDAEMVDSKQGGVANKQEHLPSFN